MSWMNAHEGNLDESGSTDNAEERSHDARDAESVNIFGTNESTFIFNASTSDYFGSIDDEGSLNHFGSLQPEQRSQSEQDQKFMHSTQRNWQSSVYQVEGPSQDSTERRSAGSSTKDWPSLQIVCPSSPLYRPVMDNSGTPSTQHMAQNRGDLKQDAGFASGSYRDTRSGGRTENTYPGMRSMPYYPAVNTGMMEESPLSYHKMGAGPASYGPSHFGSPSGYRSHIYGTPLTPRGGSNALLSPARSPAVHRRFMEPIDGYIYQVQFKRAHKNFILAPSAPRNIIPGDFVKVEADRGEDMGIVLSKSPASEFEEVIPTAGYRGRGFSSGQGERKFLFRLANADERAALVHKVHDEERALEVIRTKVLEQLLPMTILDAEYQFDRHKLTFFFEADRRIDFRELVSELFSLYKTRIWMQQVDTSVLGMSDAGSELAKATGFLPERDDHAYLQTTTHMRRLDGSAAAAASAAGPSAFGLEPADSARLLQHDAPVQDLHMFHQQHQVSNQPSQGPALSLLQPPQATQSAQPAQQPLQSQHQGYSFLSSQPTAASGLHNLQALSLALPAASTPAVDDLRDRGLHQPSAGLRGRSYSTPSLQMQYRPTTTNNPNANLSASSLEFGPGGLYDSRSSASSFLAASELLMPVMPAAPAAPRPISRLPRASAQGLMMSPDAGGGSGGGSARLSGAPMQMPMGVPVPAVMGASPWSLSAPVTNAFSPQHRQPQYAQQHQQQTYSQPQLQSQTQQQQQVQWSQQKSQSQGQSQGQSYQQTQQPPQPQPQRHHQFSPYAAPFHPMQETRSQTQSQQQQLQQQREYEQEQGYQSTPQPASQSLQYEYERDDVSAGQQGNPWREKGAGNDTDGGANDREYNAYEGYTSYDGYAGGGSSSGTSNGHTNGTPRVSGEKEPAEWRADYRDYSDYNYTDEQGTVAFEQELDRQEQNFQQRRGMQQETYPFELPNQQEEQGKQGEKEGGDGDGGVLGAHN